MIYTYFNEQEALHVFGLLDQMHTKRSTQVRNTGYLKKYASDLSHDCDKDRFGRARSTPKSPTLLLAAMSKYTIASHEIKPCTAHVLRCSFLCRVAYHATKPSCLSRLIICINNWS
jgi:hypothetical protein